MKLNIRNKFLLPTIVLIFIGMGLSSGTSYFKSKKALRTAITGEVESIASSVVNILNTWVYDRKLDISNWSKQKVYKISVKDTFVGKAARKSANKLMAGLKEEYKYYENICLANNSGNVIAASDTDVINTLEVSNRKYYKEAMEGNTNISKVVKSKETGTPVFIIASPVMENGTPVGVIFGIINIDIFSSRFIDPIKVGESGFAYVFNQEGFLLAHPDKTSILKLNLNDFDYGKEMLARQDGIMVYKWKGVENIVALKKYHELGWTIAVGAISSEIMAPITSLGRINILVSIIVLTVAALSIFIIANSIARPVNNVVAGLKDAAEGEGDLTKRLEVTSKDEVGELAKWFNVFIEKVQDIIKDVTSNAKQLDRSSRKLSEISQQMSLGAEQSSAKANSVSASSEEMSSNMNSVAAAMEQATTNVDMVSTAAEEMTGTINEIALNTEKARSITDDAVTQTSNASEQVGQLGQAAHEIGKVVEAITDISAQVNLLALNATIEAARAGEAGKGFAVVANEIKELARQTADASGEIKQKVEGIQSTTDGTVTEIEKITNVVNEVNEIVSTIATAVEEQSVTTKDIATNVSQASLGIGEVNENVAQSSAVVSEITKEIAEVNGAVGEIFDSSSQVNTNADDLAILAGQLSEMVGRFNV